MMGEGPARGIRLVVLSILALGGIALQGGVWWFGVQTASEEWGAAGLQVWIVAIAIWILSVGLLLALLWKRLKGVIGGASP